MFLKSYKKTIDKYGELVTVKRTGSKQTDQKTGKSIIVGNAEIQIMAHWQPLISTIATRGGSVSVDVTQITKLQGAIVIFSYVELKEGDIVIADSVEYQVRKVDSWHGHWESVAMRREIQNV